MKAIPAVLMVIACSACTDRDPVIADLTTITLQVPKGQEFSRISHDDRNPTGLPSKRSSISFHICDQHVVKTPEAECDLHNEFGTWVLVRAPDEEATFRLLTERPQDELQPQSVKLLPLPDVDLRGISRGSTETDEASALNRVRSEIFGDEPQLSTTDRGWPIADCDQGHSGGVNCRFGFLVEGTPVVAQWFSPGDQAGITQSQVWDVASDIDRRIRRMILDPHATQP